MRNWMACLIACTWMSSLHATEADVAPSVAPSVAPTAVSATAAETATSESQKLEKALQSLSWPQFRSVVESIPKLKADVDAYGPLGWQFVQANYTHYGWKKNIDKLDETQKQQLGELIRLARNNKIKATP